MQILHILPVDVGAKMSVCGCAFIYMDMQDGQD